MYMSSRLSENTADLEQTAKEHIESKVNLVS